MKKRHQQKLIILSFILLSLFNFPLLLLFNSSSSFLGFPVIYFYIFFVWIVDIIVSYKILQKYYE
jgi:membrane protein YdbS with pleckstrin-like domain